MKCEVIIPYASPFLQMRYTASITILKLFVKEADFLLGAFQTIKWKNNLYFRAANLLLVQKTRAQTIRERLVFSAKFLKFRQSDFFEHYPQKTAL